MLKRFNNAITQFITFYIDLSNINIIFFVNLLIINITQLKPSDEKNVIIKLNVNV